MGKNIGKHISKNLSGKYSQKRLDYAKKFATGGLKTTSKYNLKNVEKTGDLIGNKIADKFTKVSKISTQNNLETLESEIKMPKEEYIPPEKTANYW